MHDTSEAAADVVRAAIRRTAPGERVRQMLAHSETMRALALARLRERHPDRSTLELVELLLGEQLLPPVARPDGT
jgi:hypothetical protein